MNSVLRGLMPFAEEALNRLLRLDPETLARLASLHAKVIRVECTDVKFDLYLFPSEAGIQLRETSVQNADVSISGSLLAFAKLLRRPDPTALRATGVSLYGDMQVAQDLQDVLARLHIDWEEQASRLVGDVVAHELGNKVRQINAWGRKALQRLAQDTAEYWQEESRVLPRRAEVDGFLHAVDELQADVERMAQRIQGLLKESG